MSAAGRKVDVACKCNSYASIQLRRPTAAKKDKEREVVRHQQRGHPKRRYPISGAHKRRRIVNCCERDSVNKIQRTYDVKKSYQLRRLTAITGCKRAAAFESWNPSPRPIRYPR